MTGNRHAPLYVAAHDAAVWTMERCRGFERRDHALTGAPLAAALRDLLGAVTLALSFPGQRTAALIEADAACARGRVLARLARDAGPLTEAQVAHLIERLDAIGRMIGGWRRSLKTKSSEAIRPGEAPSAVSVAGRS